MEKKIVFCGKLETWCMEKPSVEWSNFLRGGGYLNPHHTADYENLDVWYEGSINVFNLSIILSLTLILIFLLYCYFWYLLIQLLFTAAMTSTKDALRKDDEMKALAILRKLQPRKSSKYFQITKLWYLNCPVVISNMLWKQT